MRLRKKQKGFTLVELILTVVILGILVVAALPSFLNLDAKAKQGSRDGVLACVRSGLRVYYAKQLTTSGNGAYPTTLDSAANGAAAVSNPIFGTICDPAVSDDNWTRSSDTQYQFDDGNSTYDYAYDSAAGTFQ